MLKTGDTVVRLDNVAHAKKAQHARRGNPFLKNSLASNATSTTINTGNQY
jgi:hypothetical protein